MTVVGAGAAEGAVGDGMTVTVCMDVTTMAVDEVLVGILCQSGQL